MKKVRPERVSAWLKDPVTKMYMEDLEGLQKETESACANGGCLGTKLSISEMYQFYQGALGMINAVRDVKKIMAARMEAGEGDE